MRAAWYDRLGSAAEVLRVGEFDTPAPAVGEVRVRVATSGVNPVDVKRRQGGRRALPAPRVIPHLDGAGTIDQVGEGVDPEREGERVWVFEAAPLGTAAEYVVVSSDRAVPLPESTSFAEGAALGVPALTAYRAVYSDGPVDGQTILVTGGAGSVGRYAVQFAKLGGARVIATVSGPEKAASATAAGADEVIDYRTESVTERVLDLSQGIGVDRIVEVELGGNLDTTVEIVRTHGVVAAYASEANREPTLPFYQLLYKGVTLHHVIVLQLPEPAKRAAVDDISGWLAVGRLSHQLGPSFPLDEIVAAHQAVERGVLGKVVVAPG